jgi:dihydropteroate synthase
MVEEGAAFLDVGGESTRPGARPVPVSDELARVLPVIDRLARSVPSSVRISIDTRRAEVARAAVDAGASVVNDVSASLGAVAAELGAGWIAMHMAGEPATMQRRPTYLDVVEEVTSFLVDRAAAARRAGAAEIWIDPGIGFGKTLEHNLALIAHLDRLVATGWPVAVGLSRKSSLGLLTARSDARAVAGVDEPTPPLDRHEASLVAATWAMAAGVDVVRVHDVRAHRHAAQVVAGTIEPRRPFPEPDLTSDAA